ncbi:hypothetical protein IID10_03600 [candidate division KSB1 bacterium]|nr:hypothetical protein [candidate division KSB1 bacterium]
MKTEIEDLYRVKYQDIEIQERALRLERSITLIDIEMQKQKKEILNTTLQNFRNTSQPMVLKKLQREVAVSRRVYNSFIQQNQGVQLEKTIAEADASNRFKILGSPQIPIAPINAGLNMILLVTLISAVCSGAGCVILKEFLDSSIRTVNEAEDAFNLPVIAVLPFLGYQPGVNKRYVFFLVAAGVSLVCLGIFAAWYFQFEPIISLLG